MSIANNNLNEINKMFEHGVELDVLIHKFSLDTNLLL